MFINENEKLIQAMNGLQIELSGFRAEMKEFKKTVEKRIDSLDVKQTQCQMNPATCSNARRLDEHMKNDAGKQGKVTAIIACVISCFNFVVMIIREFANGQ